NIYRLEIWTQVDATHFFISLPNSADNTTVNASDYVVAQVNNTTGLSVFILVPVPATLTSPGQIGDMALDSNFLYVCTATNTWSRTALSQYGNLDGGNPYSNYNS